MKVQFNCNRALEMFRSGEGADVVIEVQQNDCQEKTEFNVHKFVFMANSEVFYAAFKHKGTKEFRESRYEIEDSTATAVSQMIHYMYAGTLPEDYDVDKDSIPLMKIADKYLIRPLVELNEHKLIQSLSLENVFDRLELANLHQIDSLKSACYKRIKNDHTVDSDCEWVALKGNDSQFEGEGKGSSKTQQWNYLALEMLESGDGADSIIEVGLQNNDKMEFNVHKYVLLINSSEFRGMFSHKEIQESRIQIKDSTATVVHQMLYYIYTGDLPKDYDVDNHAIPLMYIANKYQIHPLVNYNQQKLVASITLENVLHRLEVADLHQIDSLKSACGLIIRKNLGMLKKTDKWTELEETSLRLLFSVLKEFPDYSSSCSSSYRYNNSSDLSSVPSDMN